MRYKSDPWAFLSECVYTIDQVDESCPIKLFPHEREYLKFYVRAWQRYPHIAAPKSRRMTMSWTTIALYLWDTMFKQGRFNAFVSKKEDDAGELIERAEFIYHHIPEDKIPKALLPKIKDGKMKKKPPVLEFPELNSRIQGFPMGANQLRQFTFSGIMGDESAFWPQAREFYSSSRPTLDGGGRMTLISSVGPGFFKQLVFDTLNSEIDRDTPPAGAKIHKPMQGIRIWQNPENEFLIVEIHYTADPEKRHARFKEVIQKTLPRRQYLQEYELNWDTFEGMPVYADFGERHLVSKQPEPELGLPLLCGWDFGRTPACIVAQLQEDQLVIIREFVSKNKSIAIFAPEVMAQLKVLYPNWRDANKDFRHYIDPAGFNKSELDEVTCAQQMDIKAGIKEIFPGAPLSNAFEPRYQAVTDRLIRHTKNGPGIIMHEYSAPTIVKGFRGGYMYAESALEIEPSKLRPVKNLYSHPHDALQYLCWGASELTSERSVDIPVPQYAFQLDPNDRQLDQTSGVYDHDYKKNLTI
jgi:hypothetical protein